MSETVLFDYWRSSASYRVRIALNLAGIPFKVVPVDLVEGHHRSAVHLDRNPQGLVPVLDIDGLRLTQSLAIIEYLDETRRLGILPEEPSEAAKIRALAHAIALDVHPVCNLRVAKHAAALAGGDPDELRDWMQTFIGPGLNAFEAMLDPFGQTPFCCGNTPTLADLCLIPQVYNARRWDVDLSACPKILSVESACQAHPAFAAAHPDTVRP
ncbi:maleylacetoacetate isomerase [Shimia isoporae]|uniref:Maleylacetoacetate isomerase n=1 Tax=Shimia isoporae TaxID=647720 RepID=A0A4R1NRY2_9RHOB|nr:maleylacetoacetate isomerase [Shimia isoporae]TCL07998.1 maleylacetoacetate isomerase [Shimia isoporae]